VNVLNAQLLQLNPTHAATYVGHIYQLFHEVSFDSQFFRKALNRLIKWGSFCVGGADVMKSVQFMKNLMFELQKSFLIKETIIDLDKSLNSKRQIQKER
jgi:hypothetical protein